MINFSNRRQSKGIEFGEYLKLPGFSYSYLKSEVAGTTPEFISSEKVELGKLVDAILTQPDEIDIYSPLLKRAEKIAEALKDNFGEYIKQFESQVTLSCDMEFNGISMPFRGRLDWGLKNIAVIDLKVTASKDLHGVIKHMGYDRQLQGYCGAYGVKLGYVLIFSSTTFKYDLVRMPLQSDDFWAEKIMKFGSVK